MPLGLVWNWDNAELELAVSGALRRAAPQVRIVEPSQSRGGIGLTGQWWIMSQPPYSGGGMALDLSAGLKATNVDITRLLAAPSAAGVCAGDGCPLQLIPVALRPAMVHVRLDVLDAVGASVPGPAWTLEEFIALCAVIAAALDKGVLARLGVEHVLFPLATTDLYGMAGGLEPMVLGAPGLTTLLWEAFIVGFGGAVASGVADHDE